MSGSDDVLGKALDRTLLRRIFAYVWPYKVQIAVAVLLLPITSALEIAQPYLLKKAIDEHIARGRLAGLDRLGVLYLVALLGQYGASFGQTYLTQLVGQRAMNDLRLRLHQHVLSLASSFFDRTPLGRLMTRITSDVEALNEMFASGLVSLVGDVIRLAAILIAIFGIDWKLALFSMGSAPMLFAIAAVFRRFVRDAFRDIRTKMARLNAFLQEHISGMKVVQAFAHEERVAARFDEINRDYRQANYARDRRRRRALLDHRGAGVDRDRRPDLARRRSHRRRHADLRRAGGVHRVPDQVLRPDPRPVGEVHDHAAGDGGGRAGVRAARHPRARRARARRARGAGPP